MIMCANIALSVLRCSMLGLWRGTSEMFIKALKWSAPYAPNNSLQVIWMLTSEKFMTMSANLVPIVPSSFVQEVWSPTLEKHTKTKLRFVILNVRYFLRHNSPRLKINSYVTLTFLCFCSSSGTPLQKDLNPHLSVDVRVLWLLLWWSQGSCRV